MRFRPGARLDPSQVEDRRGRGAGPVALGGGGLGVAGIVIYLVFALLGGGGGGAFSDLEGLSAPQAAATLDCSTGADANTRQDCRVLGDVNSVQQYWSGWFRAHSTTYRPANTVFFGGSTTTGCGAATSVLTPVHDPPPAMLEEAIASVRAQTYPHWELRLVDDGSTDPAITAALQRHAASDPRIHLTRH
ncbi:MAG: uncharacterized protein QOH16_2210, partial [Gaiellaceae bacterium]|nr:uncharacterized protein [Gaiellaceae bacterium]